MYRRRRYYYKSRRPVRRYKRRYPIRRTIKPKSKYDQVHLVKRFGLLISGGITSPQPVQYLNNPAADQSYRFSFRLSAVTGYQDFTALYDQFKIRAVKVSFIPMANITSAEQSGYASLIYSTYDFNGGSPVPPTLNEIREYQYCKWSPYGRIHKRYFFPRMHELDDDYSTSIKVGPQNWLPTFKPHVLYHGLVVNVSNIPSIDIDEPIYKIEVRYYLSFKNTK